MLVLSQVVNKLTELSNLEGSKRTKLNAIKNRIALNSTIEADEINLIFSLCAENIDNLRASSDTGFTVNQLQLLYLSKLNTSIKNTEIVEAETITKLVSEQHASFKTETLRTLLLLDSSPKLRALVKETNNTDQSRALYFDCLTKSPNVAFIDLLADVSEFFSTEVKNLSVSLYHQYCQFEKKHKDLLQEEVVIINKIKNNTATDADRTRYQEIENQLGKETTSKDKNKFIIASVICGILAGFAVLTALFLPGLALLATHLFLEVVLPMTLGLVTFGITMPAAMFLSEKAINLEKRDSTNKTTRHQFFTKVTAKDESNPQVENKSASSPSTQ